MRYYKPAAELIAGFAVRTAVPTTDAWPGHSRIPSTTSSTCSSSVPEVAA